MKKHTLLFFVCLCVFYAGIAQTTNELFSSMDVFGLQYVQQPQISPDGTTIVYRRMRMDIQRDKATGNLWQIDVDGSQHQKLTSFEGSESGAVWSPQGDRLAFVREHYRGE